MPSYPVTITRTIETVIHSDAPDLRTAVDRARSYPEAAGGRILSVVGQLPEDQGGGDGDVVQVVGFCPHCNSCVLSGDRNGWAIDETTGETHPSHAECAVATPPPATAG